MNIFLHLILSTALLLPSYSYGKEPHQQPDLIYILNNFPICKISSSVGQKCKSLSERKRATFSIKDLAQNSKPHFEENNTIIIKEEGWYYTFRLDNSDVIRPKVSFIDDSKFGSYFTSATFNLSYSEEQKNWVLISEVVHFIAGSKEDKEIEGKIIPFVPPIPFIPE